MVIIIVIVAIVSIAALIILISAVLLSKLTIHKILNICSFAVIVSYDR